MTGTTRKLTDVMTSRLARTILVHEWVTGGGLAGSPVPASWAAEGTAMRRAIATEFAAVADVVVTLDARFDEDPGRWSLARIADGAPDRLARLAGEADLTVLIAPETTGIMGRLTRQLQETGTRLLGSTPRAIGLTGDKAALATHLSALRIETPPCLVIDPRDGLPRDATYPAVIKPVDGAGTVDTFLVEHAEDLPEVDGHLTRAILQPFVDGRPMSASFLVDTGGRAWLLGIGEQIVTIGGNRFEYKGGRLPVRTPVDEAPIRSALESVPGLRGFVGVDFIWDERREKTTVLEINPRPTTSVVGLVRLLPPGVLASAWIGAFEPGSAGEARLPELAGLIRARPTIAFDASGNPLEAGGRR